MQVGFECEGRAEAEVSVEEVHRDDAETESTRGMARRAPDGHREQYLVQTGRRRVEECFSGTEAKIPVAQAGEERMLTMVAVWERERGRSLAIADARRPREYGRGSG